MKHAARFATFVVLAAFCLAQWSGCGGSSDRDNQNNGANSAPAPYPNIPGGGGTLNANRNLAFLMKNFASAVINPTPWAGYWFPYQDNGVAASASKYDAVTGQNAAGWERANHGLGLGSVADWWGHCNGWAAASVLIPEPRQAREVSGRTFDVADRKALLSEAFMEVTGDFLGTRVDDPNDFSSAAFEDVVPAQLFLVLTSIMGGQDRAIIVDRYTGNEVWNHPLVAYSVEPVRAEDYLGPDPRFANLHRVNMTTTIFWVDDGVDPGILTPAFDPGSPAEVFASRTLRYELWLDAPPKFDASGQLSESGEIVLAAEGDQVAGGAWKNSALPSVNSHPDYIWIPTGPASSSGFKNPRLDDAWVQANMR